MTTAEPIDCKNCGALSSGTHCQTCGQKLHTERITLHTILHEVMHYFTHLDKGFGYTIKELIVHPGAMQKEFIEGRRSRYQKPFSMFFLCGTICGLGYYFINLAYLRLYNADNTGEADFFRHYFVLMQAFLLPLYSLFTWAVFYNAKRNYAEILVLMLYSLSLVFLVLIFINAAKLIFPHYENRYTEVLFLLVYNYITNANFFGEKKWVTVLKTILAMGICYAISQVATQSATGYLHH